MARPFRYSELARGWYEGNIMWKCAQKAGLPHKWIDYYADVSEILVNEKVLKGTLKTGIFHGFISRACPLHKEVLLVHTWIRVPGRNLVIDPCRWIFENRHDPALHVGREKLAYREFDDGLLSMVQGTPPPSTGEGPYVWPTDRELMIRIFMLTRGEWRPRSPLSVAQVHWLLTQPHHVFEGVEKSLLAWAHLPFKPTIAFIPAMSRRNLEILAQYNERSSIPHTPSDGVHF